MEQLSTDSFRQYIFLFLSVLICTSFYINYEEQEMMTIIAGSGLNLRSEPNITSDVLLNVPFGSEVLADVVDKGHYDTIFISTEKILINQWYKTQINGKQGYLFGSFLYPSKTINKKEPYNLSLIHI